MCPLAASPREPVVNAAGQDPRRWREAFVRELRAQGIPGDQVSRAVLTVERRCAASGRPEPQEFGDPVKYARAVFDPGRRSTGWAWLGGAFGAALGLGLTLVIRGAQSVLGDGPAVIGVGESLGVVLLGGALLGVGPALSAISRPGPRQQLRLLAGTVVLVLVLLLPALLGRLLDGGVVELDGAFALLLGLAVAGAAGLGLAREMGRTYEPGKHPEREAVRQAGMVPVPRWLVLLTVGSPVLVLVVYAIGR